MHSANNIMNFSDQELNENQSSFTLESKYQITTKYKPVLQKNGTWTPTSKPLN